MASALELLWLAYETAPWVSMSLQNGFTVASGGVARYRLTKGGRGVWVQAVLNVGSTANGVTFWTAPAGLVPVVQQDLELILISGTGSAAVGSPWAQITTAGALSCHTITTQVGTVVALNDEYALD